MARTKRKINPILPVAALEKAPQRIYQAGGYVRLSVEDSGRPGADTIETQRELIQSYIEAQPDLRLYDLYCDNGRTGTNFDRPEFERIMQDVRTGKVDCIVVKEDCVIIELNQKALENRDFVMWFCFFDPKTDTFYTLLAQGGGARRVERPQQHS